jgi:hypothetical protein
MGVARECKQEAKDGSSKMVLGHGEEHEENI